MTVLRVFCYFPAACSAAPLLKLGLRLIGTVPLRRLHAYPARCPEQSLVHSLPKKSSSLTFFLRLETNSIALMIMSVRKDCVSSHYQLEVQDTLDSPLSTDPDIAIHTILWIPTLHPITTGRRRRWSIIHWGRNVHRTRLYIYRLRLYIVRICYYTTC